MRGRPLLEWGLFLAVWLLLLVPLRMVTSHTNAASEPRVPAPASPTRHVWITLRFSDVPKYVVLSQESRALWEANGPASQSVECEAEVALSGNAADIDLSVSWVEAEGTKAVEMVLEPDGWESRSRTVWGKGSALKEVLTYQW